MGDDRWGQAFLQQLELTDLKQRLRLIDTALSAHPPAQIVPWFYLMRAQALLAGGLPVPALDEVERIAEQGTPRQKYEAALVASDILVACNRISEARDQLRYAEDIGRRELYTDPGIDIAVPASKHDAIGRSDEEKLWRDAESSRGRRDFAPALARYRELVSRYPSSRWRDASIVQSGWCQIGIGKVEEAEKNWQAFIASNPTGPWRGRALLALVDAALEARGDPGLAHERCLALEAGIAGQRGITLDDNKDPGNGWDGVERETVLRRILLLLVSGDHASAKIRASAMLASGNPADRVRTLVTGSPWYSPASGVGKLLEAIARGEPPTPATALIAGKDRVNLHLLLSDLFQMLDEPEKAQSHLSVVLAGLVSIAPVQKNYARMRQGDLAYTAGQLDVFRTAYRDCLLESPRNPWSAHQSLILAVDAFSRRGKEDEALKQFGEIQSKFPNSHEAQTAGWYRGVIAYWKGRWAEADSAWQDLDRRYPGHEWTALINDHYRPRVRAAIAVGLPPDMEPAKVDLPQVKTQIILKDNNQKDQK